MEGYIQLTLPPGALQTVLFQPEFRLIQALAMIVARSQLLLGLLYTDLINAVRVDAANHFSEKILFLEETLDELISDPTRTLMYKVLSPLSLITGCSWALTFMALAYTGGTLRQGFGGRHKRPENP